MKKEVGLADTDVSSGNNNKADDTNSTSDSFVVSDAPVEEKSFKVPPPMFRNGFKGDNANGFTKPPAQDLGKPPIGGTPPPYIPPQKKRSFGVYIIVLIIVFLLAGSGYLLYWYFGSRASAPNRKTEVKITMWGLYEDPVVMTELGKRFKAINSNVSFEYVRKDPNTYDDEINNALAENRAPDIWQARNDKLYSQKDKIAAAPETLTLDQFVASFPAVAAEDLWWPRPVVDTAVNPYKVDIDDARSKGSKIYAVPWSIDTLGLIYNAALFKEKEITLPPANWEELLGVAKKLQAVSGPDVYVSGIALGLGSNINEAADIMSLLFMQNHAKIVSDDQRSALFNNAFPSSTGESVPVGTQALDFYVSFALPAKADAYNWNRSFTNSVQAFVDGKTAMIIDYSFQIDTIKNLSPALALQAAPVPQVKNVDVPINYARYYGNVVSRNSKNAATAWNFLLFSLQKENMEMYFKGSHKLPALLSLVDEYQNYETLGPFINQIKTAHSYFKGNKPDDVDKIIAGMADSVVLKGEPLQITIDQGAKMVTDSLIGSSQ